MKQHITTEQLNELSRKAKDKFRQYDRQFFEGKHVDGMTLFSVGQMIEFLTENTYLFEIKSHHTEKSRLPLYNITAYGLDIEDHHDLCDALWEATKITLERLANK